MQMYLHCIDNKKIKGNKMEYLKEKLQNNNEVMAFVDKAYQYNPNMNDNELRKLMVEHGITKKYAIMKLRSVHLLYKELQENNGQWANKNFPSKSNRF